VDCDSKKHSTPANTLGLIVANVRSYMGRGISNKTGDSGDNLLECVSTTSPLDYLRMIASSTGVISPKEALCSGQSVSITLIPSNTPLQVDGEIKTRIRDGRLDLSLRRMVSVLAPQQ
jgi:hypothetical protein